MIDAFLVRVASVLDRFGIDNALIGAGALAVHGVSRSTLDRDLLATDPRALESRTWAELRDDVRVDIRRGDDEDPLLGVVRLLAAADAAVDVVVGRHRWQTLLIEAAPRVRMPNGEIRVVSAAGIVLLKLFAGGAQDLWDIEQLRAALGASLDAQVDESIRELPVEAGRLWQQLKAETANG
jgi:hypothetical protein